MFKKLIVAIHMFIASGTVFLKILSTGAYTCVYAASQSCPQEGDMVMLPITVSLISL